MKPILGYIIIGILAVFFSILRADATWAQARNEVEALIESQGGFDMPPVQSVEKVRAPEESFPIKIEMLQVDRAIEMALTHNSDIKVALAELGIAQANLKQAGLLENPQLSLWFGVETESPHFLPAGSLSHNFLDFFLVGLRKKTAESELKETQFMAADRVLDFIFGVKKAYFTLQGAEQFRQLVRGIAEASQVSANFAQKLYAAGNINLLELNAHKLVAENALVELTKVEAEVGTSREALMGFMGLKAGELEFRKIPKMPSVPVRDPDLRELEILALERRLDLKAAKQRIESLERNLKLAERQFLSHFNFGMSVEREDSGAPVMGPEISVPLPLSDRNQAQKAKVKAQLVQSRYEVSALERRIQTEVRNAHAKMMEDRKIARHYQNQIIPLLRKTMAETQLHYNFMLKSPFDLLQAKKEEIGANRAHLEALRDYWIHQAVLERAIGANFQTVKGSTVKK